MRTNYLYLLSHLCFAVIKGITQLLFSLKQCWRVGGWGGGVRRFRRGPGYVAYVFVCLDSTIICRLYKSTLSDQAQVTVQLRVYLSDLVQMFVASPPLLRGGGVSAGPEPALGGPGWKRLDHLVSQPSWLHGRSVFELPALDQISYGFSCFSSVPSGICRYSPSSVATVAPCHIFTK
jgi:hypothetical protein